MRIVSRFARQIALPKIPTIIWQINELETHGLLSLAICSFCIENTFQFAHVLKYIDISPEVYLLIQNSFILKYLPSSRKTEGPQAFARYMGSSGRAEWPTFLLQNLLTYETMIYLKWKDIICGTFWCIKKIYDNFENFVAL